MHCYEYLAMHLYLKAYMKRQFPDHQLNVLEIGELLDALNVTALDELLLIQNQPENQAIRSKLGIYSQNNSSKCRRLDNPGRE